MLPLATGSLRAQKQEEPAAAAASGEARSAPALRALMANIDAAAAEMAQKRAVFQQAVTPEEKAAASKEIDALREKIDGLRLDFASLAAGRNWRTVSAPVSEKFDMAQEVEQLLRPILREMRGLTANPREIESLRSMVNDHRRREVEVKAAIDHLAALVESLPEGDLKPRLLALRGDWDMQFEQIRNDLEVAQFQLAEKLASQRTVLGTFREFTASFFRSRGRNLLLAGFAFVGVFVLLRLIRWYVLRIHAIRSRFRRSFAIRFLDILYYVFCVLGATTTMLVVLYSSGDWVLLGVAILFLAGFAWASKTVLPGFYEQAKLLLNLGPVREGERVVFNGVPWEVQTINFYTELANPAFEGARIRLPLRDLLALNSRPTEESLPWFPCRRNDWVRLSDQTRGKVVELTPEWVRLVLLGGSRKTYTVAAFLDLHPESLSHNFRVRVRFGIDYAHQADATTRVPELMESAVKAGLLAMIDHADLKNLSVDFCEAAASSLDYLVLADFSGHVAPRAEQLERAIQRMLVEAANEHGWVIPFQQLTVHQAH
ncbi:MAG: hypothetical protein ABMA13_15715 [Chthoniobacteraceae bacterium]